MSVIFGSRLWQHLVDIDHVRSADARGVGSSQAGGGWIHVEGACNSRVEVVLQPDRFFLEQSHLGGWRAQVYTAHDVARLVRGGMRLQGHGRLRVVKALLRSRACLLRVIDPDSLV